MCSSAKPVDDRRKVTDWRMVEWSVTRKVWHGFVEPVASFATNEPPLIHPASPLVRPKDGLEESQSFRHAALISYETVTNLWVVFYDGR